MIDLSHRAVVRIHRDKARKRLADCLADGEHCIVTRVVMPSSSLSVPLYGFLAM